MFDHNMLNIHSFHVQPFTGQGFPTKRSSVSSCIYAGSVVCRPDAKTFVLNKLIFHSNSKIWPLRFFALSNKHNNHIKCIGITDLVTSGKDGQESAAYHTKVEPLFAK